MSKRTKPDHVPAGSAIDGLPYAIEVIRNAYQAHIEFENAVRLAVNVATSVPVEHGGEAAIIAIAQIRAALDKIST